MNILFWTLVSLLILIALCFVIYPLWKKTELPDADAEQRNISIARQRLADLKQQLQDGAISQAQFEEQYEELGLALNDDLDSIQDSLQSTKQGHWIIPVIVIFLPLLSISLYLVQGETQALYKAEQQQLARQQQQDTQQNINNMVTGLAARLQQTPDDAEGWMMLGRSYKYMKKYRRSADAYAQAYRLLGDQVSVMLEYADALAMAGGGSLSGQPAELIFKSLKLAPDDVTALWLAGMAKAEAGEFRQALGFWRTLEPLLPQQSESLRDLQGLMTALKTRLAGGEAPETSAVIVRASVSLAEILQNQVQPSDTIFIYAQAMSGPKMPLAIIRKQVSDLPLTVELNDDMAMTPAMKLSSVKQVKVLARVSKSGNAMPQKGDLFGMADLTELSAESSVNITINQVLK